MKATSHAGLIGEVSDHMLRAFKKNNVRPGEVLEYDRLYAYLHEKADHYKDVQKEAEQHLAKEGFVNPAPEGLRLTDIGYQHLDEMD